MLSLKPTTPKEQNTEAENWQNVAEDTSKAMSLGIALGTVASAILGGGLPIIIGTAVGSVVSVIAAVYDLTRDYPGLTDEEMACVEELDALLLKNKGKPLRTCKGCDELPSVGHDLKACVKIRERLREEELSKTKACNPCVAGDTNETCKDEEKTDVDKGITQPPVHPKLAKKFEELKPYQQSTDLKRFTSKPTPSFWDNYVPEKKEKNAKPIPLKRFTTPSYRKTDDN
ncbi:hypothetical protein LSTR_LSTR012756 [Laodelphax striatellus]|uniref:Uncharacterized protein n=1 Tax=Laodelphax striatellus TaxID=195883 RepID=A0A482WUG1_LAOST|nr:hypothetical protein LSTR_LSTR012756 [Laodelphax striatellus]